MDPLMVLQDFQESKTKTFRCLFKIPHRTWSPEEGTSQTVAGIAFSPADDATITTPHFS